MSPEEFDYWEGKVLEARRGQLEVVRKAAAAWTALLTAVLGVFGTATFVTGLPGLDDIADPLATALRWCVIVIAAALLMSVVSAGMVASSFPSVTNGLTAAGLRGSTKLAAVTARSRLRLSLISGAFAAVLLVLGSVTVALAPSTPSAKALPTMLVTTSNSAACGPLSQSPNGALQVAGVSLSGAVAVTIVDACPSPAQTP